MRKNVAATKGYFKDSIFSSEDRAMNTLNTAIPETDTSDEWKEIIDSSGKKAYINLRSGNSSYNPPERERKSDSENLAVPVKSILLTSDPKHSTDYIYKSTFSILPEFLSKKDGRISLKSTVENNSKTASSPDVVSPTIVYDIPRKDKSNKNITKAVAEYSEEYKTHSGTDLALDDPLKGLEGISDIEEQGRIMQKTADVDDEEVESVKEICERACSSVEEKCSLQLDKIPQEIQALKCEQILVNNSAHEFKFTKDILKTFKVSLLYLLFTNT